jgi:hypothetical protein
VYSACAHGHANQYQLFVERGVRLVREGGRLGLVLPWGLASDHGSAGLRRLLLERGNVESIVGFENTEGIFPIHRGVRFLLLSASRGGPTGRVRCRFGVRDPSSLEPAAPVPPEPSGDTGELVVTPSLLGQLAGPGLAFPYVRRAAELRLLERLAAAFPPLGAEAGWAARFGRELNATDDRGRFVTARGAIAVVEGKHVDPFRVRVAEVQRWIRSPEDLPSAELACAASRARLAYRDVASATNRATLIAALVPAGVITVHTLFCLRTPMPEDDQWLLCGVLNSLAANFLVRPWVTTHLGTSTVERLPVPRPAPAAPERSRIVALARRLSADPGDDDARAEIEARAFLLYGVSAGELPIVIGTFPLLDRRVAGAIAGWFGRLASHRGQV